MKIAIDGTQSTGKTTIWERFKDLKLKHEFNFIPELNTFIAKEHFGIYNPSQWNSLLDNKAKYKIFVETLIDYQVREEEKNQSFIIDSSLYRICSYAIEFGLEEYRSNLNSINYDLIFFCPIEFDIVNNGFRTDHFRNEIDKRLFSIIKKHHRGELIILNGTVEQRMKQIQNSVSYFS